MNDLDEELCKMSSEKRQVERMVRHIDFHCLSQRHKVSTQKHHTCKCVEASAARMLSRRADLRIASRLSPARLASRKRKAGSRLGLFILDSSITLSVLN